MSPKDFGTVTKVLRRDLSLLIRASYLALRQAAEMMDARGYTLDRYLSTDEVKVFYSDVTGAVVCYRGTVNAGDWGTDLALGVGILGKRHKQAKALMERVQAKFGPAHAIGHSLGGHLAENSGAQGLILTADKAVGVRDLALQARENQLDVRARGDVVSALSRGGLREEVTPPPIASLSPHIPLPIRAPIGAIVHAVHAHNYRYL